MTNCLEFETMTMKLDDMKLFAALAEAGSFTVAARRLSIPKQTLSRRIAELERVLATQLVLRTTRRMKLTSAGAQYAARCAEVSRLAEDANRALTTARDALHGPIRITADPLFGETFLAPVLLAFAKRWPGVTLDVLYTQRRVDLVEDGFDIAIRIGRVEDASLVAIPLGPARIRYVASPAYLRRRGKPQTPAELAEHDAIVVRADPGPAQWPFRGTRSGMRLVTVAGRLRCNSHALAYAAAIAGLGVAIVPQFACAADLRRKRLVSILDEHRVDVGSVWLVHPAQRPLTARVQRFVELAAERLARAAF
jgi:DNA-binding transcriptional LysR family regulator